MRTPEMPGYGRRGSNIAFGFIEARNDGALPRTDALVRTLGRLPGIFNLRVDAGRRSIQVVYDGQTATIHRLALNIARIGCDVVAQTCPAHSHLPASLLLVFGAAGLALVSL